MDTAIFENSQSYDFWHTTEKHNTYEKVGWNAYMNETPTDIFLQLASTL